MPELTFPSAMFRRYYGFRSFLVLDCINLFAFANQMFVKEYLLVVLICIYQIIFKISLHILLIYVVLTSFAYFSVRLFVPFILTKVLYPFLSWILCQCVPFIFLSFPLEKKILKLNVVKLSILYFIVNVFIACLRKFSLLHVLKDGSLSSGLKIFPFCFGI